MLKIIDLTYLKKYDCTMERMHRSRKTCPHQMYRYGPFFFLLITWLICPREGCGECQLGKTSVHYNDSVCISWLNWLGSGWSKQDI